MRVLVIAPQPFYQERGTPIATRLLIEALSSAGHAVDVLTYHVGENPGLPGVRVFRSRAVPFVRDVPIGFSLRKVLCDFMLAGRLWTLTRENRYDVLRAFRFSRSQIRPRRTSSGTAPPTRRLMPSLARRLTRSPTACASRPGLAITRRTRTVSSSMTCSDSVYSRARNSTTAGIQ
jgi:hypothetical protein